MTRITWNNKGERLVDGQPANDQPARLEPPVVLELTPSQAMALADVILEYLQAPGRMHKFVDVIRNVETTPGELLERVLDAQRRQVRP